VRVAAELRFTTASAFPAAFHRALG